MSRLDSEKIQLQNDIKRLDVELKDLKEHFQIAREEKRKLSQEVIHKTSRLAALENQVCNLKGLHRGLAYVKYFFGGFLIGLQFLFCGFFAE